MPDRELSYYEKYWLQHEGLRGPNARLDFIEIFKKDTIEEGGKNDKIAPFLYEMVLLEILARIELLETGLRDSKGKHE